MKTSKRKFRLFPLLIFVGFCILSNHRAKPSADTNVLTGQISATSSEASVTSSQGSDCPFPTNSHEPHKIDQGTPATTGMLEKQVEFWEYRAGLLFQAYGGIVVVVLGFFGNILTLAVLISNYPMNSSTVYLIQLAASDLGVICVGQLLRNFPRAWTGFDSGSQHPWICKFWFFVNHSFKTISGWTLVAVTVERVIAVYLPFKAKSFCTKERAKIVIAVIDVLCIGCYLHYFWTYGALYGPEGQLEAGCTIMKHKPELAYYITMVRPWQDLAVRTGGPFFCLLICNCLIVGKLFQQIKRRKQMAMGTNLNDSKTQSITKMLLTVSFAFLILIAPMQIMYLVDRSDPYGWVITERWQAVAALRWGIAAPLYYLNHAINFILYCFFGREFRLALKNMSIKMVSKLPCAHSKGSDKDLEYKSKCNVATISSAVKFE